MNRPLLKHYARAIFEVSQTEKALDVNLKGLTLVADTLSDHPDVSRFFASRMVSYPEKVKVLESLFATRVTPTLLAFVKIVVEKHLSDGMTLIQEDYRHYCNELNNIMEGIIYSAFPLTQEVNDKITQLFENKFHKTIIFRNVIDKRVIAGMKIFLNDTVYDYSLDTKINTIKNRLLYTKSL
jgi:F-type H+-transporting ATPase subunit delta